MKALLKLLYHPIKRGFSKLLLNAYREEFEKNISCELQRLALKSTAEYVRRNVSRVSSYQNKFDLYDEVLKLVPRNGLWMEFGVYRGETINYFSKIAPRNIYGFDSFEGLPEFWRDGFGKGHFRVDGLPKVPDNVELVKGWFNETLPIFLSEHKEPIAFLHIDCDLYSSTVTILEACAERISDGTVIIFDEYFNYPGWEEGEFKAFQEFILKFGFKYEYVGYVRTHEQVAVRIIKS